MSEEADTKELILHNALELFARKGYEATGIMDIIVLAGITKPTLYYYFGSKQGLLEAIVTGYGDRLLDTIRIAAGYSHNLVMNLRDILKVTLEFAHTWPAFYRLGVNLFSSAPETTEYEVGSKLKLQLLDILEELFIEAAKDHGNMKMRHKIYAEMFLGLLNTFALLSLNGELKIDNHLQYRIIHQYMHGIFS